MTARLDCFWPWPASRLKAKALAMTLLPHDFSVITATTTGSFVEPS
jgi:hypothetical protein